MATQPELDVTGAPCLQYQLDGVTLDVWTDICNGRRTIEGVSLPGSRVDLLSMLSQEQINDIRRRAELTLPTRAELAQDMAEV